jgi:ribonuclease R
VSIDDQSSLYKYLSDPKYVPVPLERIIEDLGFKRAQARSFKRMVSELLLQGSLVRIKGDRICLPKEADLITGIIHFRPDGSGYLVVDKTKKNPLKNDQDYSPATVWIRAEDTNIALHKDRVVLRLLAGSKKNLKGKRRTIADKQTYGRVIEVLQRAHINFTGTLRVQRNIAYIIPDDPHIHQDILIGKISPIGEQKLIPQAGDKVIVKMLEWTHRNINPIGEITAVIGPSHTPQTEYLTLLHKYNLNPTFSEAVQTEALAIPSRVDCSAIEKRVDCRKIFTVTIDPDDAKDFDDALSIEYLSNNEVRIGVHIADVSAYVKPNSALDKEAAHRGNSTYLVGAVIPMLPHHLSSGICSLIENEDRLVQSVFFVFDEDSNIKNYTFARSVIRSQKRLTYTQALAFLTFDSLEKIRALPHPVEFGASLSEDLPAKNLSYTGCPLRNLSDENLLEIQKALHAFWSIASKIRNCRMKEGSLNLEMPAARIQVDANGFADRIKREENDISHQLIEEFMLLANETVARVLHKSRMPFISRVHEDPDPEKLEELRDYLSTFRIRVGDLTKKEEVMKLLTLLREHPQGHLLRVEFLKSLKKACYKADTTGHYGLHKTYYTHFTSPIRRYTDLVVHRILTGWMLKEGLISQDTPFTRYSIGELSRLGDHLSQTERISIEAERESVKIKILEFFERQLTLPEIHSFEAIIVDVKNHGIFVELTESMAFGLVHVSSLHDDMYYITNDGNSLIGRRTRRVFRLGGTIQVRPIKVDRFKRQIDFAIADIPKKSKAPDRKPSAYKKKTKQKSLED